MFDGLAGDVDAEVGAVAVVRDLDVDGEALCVLSVQTCIFLKCLKIDRKYKAKDDNLGDWKRGRGWCVCEWAFRKLNV